MIDGNISEDTLLLDPEHTRKPWYRRRRSALIAMLSFVVMTVLVVFVCVPYVSQKTLNGTYMLINEMTISDPSEHSCVMTVNSVIGGLGHLKAKTPEFVVDVSGPSGVFGTLTLPKMSLFDDITEVNVTSTLMITNQSAFGAFNHDLVFGSSASLTMLGNPKVSPVLGGLTLWPVHVKFNKTVEIVGCQGLKNSRIVDFSLKSSTSSQLVTEVLVEYENPASLAITNLGDLSFDLYYDGFMIGPATAYNASLSFERGTMSMLGSILFENHDSAQELLSKYVSGNPSTVQALAGEEASTVSIFNGGLHGLRLSTTLPGISTPLIESLKIYSLSMVPVGPSSVHITAPSFVTLQNLVGNETEFDVSSVDLGVRLYFGGTTEVIEDPPIYLGMGVIERLPVAESTANGFAVTIDNDVVLDNDGSGMSMFLASYVASADNVFFYLIGNSSATASTVAGEFDLHGIPMNLQVELQGMNFLRDNSVLTIRFPEVATNSTGIPIEFHMSIVNPSIGSVDLGNVELSLTGINEDFDPVSMGSVTTNMSLTPGQNKYIFVGKLTSEPSAIGAFLTDYLIGTDDSEPGLSYESSSIADQYDWMKAPIQNLAFGFVFPDYKHNPTESACSGFVLSNDTMSLTFDITLSLTLPYPWAYATAFGGELLVNYKEEQGSSAWEIASTTVTQGPISEVEGVYLSEVVIRLSDMVNPGAPLPSSTASDYSLVISSLLTSSSPIGPISFALPLQCQAQ